MHQTSQSTGALRVPEEFKLATKKRYRSGRHLFLSFFWKSPVLIGFSLFMNVIASFAQTVPAVLIGTSLAILTTNGFGQEFILSCLLIVGISLVSMVASASAGYAFGVTAFAYERDVRQEYFDVIQGHSLTFHDEHNSSRLLATGMTEITQLRMGLNPSMRMLTQSIISIFFTLFFLYNIGPKYDLTTPIGNFSLPIFASITAIGLIIYFVLAYGYSRRIIVVRENLANSIGRLTEASQEIFRGIDVVRGFSAETKEKQRFNKESNTYAKFLEKEGKLQAFYLPGLVLMGVTVLVFGLGLLSVANNLMEVPELVQAVGLLIAFQVFNFLLPMALLNIQAALTNSNRIWKILNWEDPQPDTAFTSKPDINWKGSIKFENVTFSYNSKPSLKNINVEIPGGAKVALIGGPGSGKSTFLKLLLRLYDPQEGQVLAGDIKFSEIPAADIRKHVSRVEQEIFLFTGTIKENVAFATPNATDEEIITACEAAMCHEFIEKMPHQYDSIIGERGITLSGGQRQRIAIARALLADPDILLLDDSHSAIDSKTELLMRKALDELMRNRTSIVVTQRLNTLVTADLIILLEKGEALAIGKHEDLLKTCPEYKRIFELLPESEQVRIEGGDY
ncbi:MAG: ABC transporter ATP-binding protein [Candidatus Hodarchaeota archaeon]